MKMYKGVSLAVLGAVLIGGFQNCSQGYDIKVTARSVDSTGGIPSPLPGNCDLQALTRPIKVMFVVDASGSNATSSGGVPATDPQKVFRGGSISAFFNNYSSKTNFSWGFETFQGSTAKPLIKNANNQAKFGNASEMSSALTAFYAGTDKDGTPYVAGLNGAKTALSGDPDIHSTDVASPLYSVIFMSDGYPDEGGNMSGINSLIGDIIFLAPGRVTLSTVYYGTQYNPSAANVLASMALLGQGHFVEVDTGSTGAIVIDDVVMVRPENCSQ